MKLPKIPSNWRWYLFKLRNPSLAYEIEDIFHEYINIATDFNYIWKKSDSSWCGNPMCCPILWWQESGGFCYGTKTEIQKGVTSIDIGSHNYRVKTLYGRHKDESEM